MMTLDNIKDQLSKFNDTDILKLRGHLDFELSRRGISFNVGLLGEKLSINYFNSTPNLPNLQQAPTGVKNVDALSREGDRYSIKTFLKAKKTGTIYPDNKDQDKQLFEYMLIVGLDKFYKLNAIYRLTWQKFVKLRAWDKRMNAWYISLSKSKLNIAENIYSKGN